jgi:hypothetical protein
MHLNKVPDQIQTIIDRLTQIERYLKESRVTLEDPIYDTDTVLEILKISRRTLQNWRDNGWIEYSAINGKFYYKQSAIDKMLNKNLINQEVCYGK